MHGVRILSNGARRFSVHHVCIEIIKKASHMYIRSTVDCYTKCCTVGTAISDAVHSHLPSIVLDHQRPFTSSLFKSTLAIPPTISFPSPLPSLPCLPNTTSPPLPSLHRLCNLDSSVFHLRPLILINPVSFIAPASTLSGAFSPVLICFSPSSKSVERDAPQPSLRLPSSWSLCLPC